MHDRLEQILAKVDDWPAGNAAVAALDRDGLIARHGDTSRPFAWASVSKLATALAVHVAVERGQLAYDEPAGPPGSAVRHLLAHASGLGFEGDAVLSRPGATRIYSNPGYDALGTLLAQRLGGEVTDILDETVLRPLGMTAASLVGRASQGIEGTLADLAALAHELLRPTLITPRTHLAMTTVAFPGLAGIVPGIGRFEPCDWGLGPELRGAKTPHWTGARNTAATFGHFGGTGTFVWMDPDLGIGLACLTDRAFGPWALDAWPALSDAVIDATDRPTRRPA